MAYEERKHPVVLHRCQLYNAAAGKSAVLWINTYICERNKTNDTLLVNKYWAILEQAHSLIDMLLGG